MKKAKTPKKHGGKRPGAGRKKSEDPRTHRIGPISYTDAELARLTAAAKEDGVTLVEWIRERSLRAR